jgi:outer membrane protein OmpA-like peptidoglycan-associated protein
VLGDAGMYFVPAVIIEPNAKTRQRLKGYTFPVLVAMDKPLPLPAVDFEKSSSKLQPVAEFQLEQLANFMQQNPSCTVELVINVQGSDDALSYNLSLERGRAIRNLLRDMNIDESRVTISAYGNVNTKKGEAPGVSIRFRQQ